MLACEAGIGKPRKFSLEKCGILLRVLCQGNFGKISVISGQYYIVLYWCCTSVNTVSTDSLVLGHSLTSMTWRNQYARVTALYTNNTFIVASNLVNLNSLWTTITFCTLLFSYSRAEWDPKYSTKCCYFNPTEYKPSSTEVSLSASQNKSKNSRLESNAVRKSQLETRRSPESSKIPRPRPFKNYPFIIGALERAKRQRYPRENTVRPSQ